MAPAKETKPMMAPSASPESGTHRFLHMCIHSAHARAPTPPAFVPTAGYAVGGEAGMQPSGSRQLTSTALGCEGKSRRAECATARESPPSGERLAARQEGGRRQR